MLDLLLISLFVLATSLAMIILKLGVKGGAPVHYLSGKITFNLNRYSISGIALYILSFIIYTYLISRNELGYIIPLTTALVYIILFPASHFLFHERFTKTKVIGICLILCGLILLNIKV